MFKSHTALDENDDWDDASWLETDGEGEPEPD